MSFPSHRNLPYLEQNNGPVLGGKDSAATRYGGAVAACGLAGGFDLPLTVMPFILRGVTLAGVDSVNCPKVRRLEAWARLANDLEMSHIQLMMQEIALADVLALAPKQIAGDVWGRVVVDVNA